MFNVLRCLYSTIGAAKYLAPSGKNDSNVSGNKVAPSHMNYDLPLNSYWRVMSVDYSLSASPTQREALLVR